MLPRLDAAHIGIGLDSGVFAQLLDTLITVTATDYKGLGCVLAAAKCNCACKL
jgi:hypothetical protein